MSDFYRLKSIFSVEIEVECFSQGYADRLLI
jgi:hypothetical protein